MRVDLSCYRSRTHFRHLAAVIPRAERYFRQRTAIDSDPTLGVGGTTFRAFRGIERPSAVFRRWANGVIGSERFAKAVLGARTRNSFEELHARLSRSLTSHWKRESGASLSLAHQYKLIDLFVKRVCRFELQDPRMHAILVAHGHVPIDSSVLGALDHLFSGIFLTVGRAMGHIKTEQAYRFYQELIRTFMADLGAPPLYFDFHAWNLGRDAT